MMRKSLSTSEDSFFDFKLDHNSISKSFSERMKAI